MTFQGFSGNFLPCGVGTTDLEEYIKSFLGKLGAVTQIDRMVNSEKDRSVIQRDLDHMVRWANCKFINLRTKSVGHGKRTAFWKTVVQKRT